MFKQTSTSGARKVSPFARKPGCVSIKCRGFLQKHFFNVSIEGFRELNPKTPVATSNLSVYPICNLGSFTFLLGTPVIVYLMIKGGISDTCFLCICVCICMVLVVCVRIATVSKRTTLRVMTY